MTVVTFASVKGAPGVTTLACLVGAGWPDQRKVMVAECDPSGGDLAARFHLSSRSGWPSFVAAARRAESDIAIGPHLQQLPGGLDVLVGTKGMDDSEGTRSMVALRSSAASSSDGPWDVLVDLGRLLPGEMRSAAWLVHSDAVVIGVRSDAASVVHVREKAGSILDRCHGTVGLAVVGSGSYTSTAIEQFTGIPVFGEIPFDPSAAAVAAGEQCSERRLRRSLLVTSAFRLAAVLAQCPNSSDARGIAVAAESPVRDGRPQDQPDPTPLRVDKRRRAGNLLPSKFKSSSSRERSGDIRAEEALK